MSELGLITIPVSGMSCGGCASRAERALQSVSGLSEVNANFAAGTAQFRIDTPESMAQAIAALDKAGYPVVAQDVRFDIKGMSCASCVARLQKVFAQAPGVVSGGVNLADNSATISYVPGLTNQDTLIQLIAAEGYLAQNNVGTDQPILPDDRVDEAAGLRRQVILAFALALPVFLLEMGGHVFPPLHHLIGRTIGHQTSWIIQFVLTTAVLIGPGRRFFVEGSKALSRKAPDMNSLVAIGAGAAWLYSTVVLFSPGLIPAASRAVYFEAAAVIVALILLGRWLEARAKGQTGAAIRKLAALQPRTALMRQGNDWVETAVADLTVGDVFMVKPAQRMPTDARVVEGQSNVDESMLTGEPMPVAKSTGDPVTGGTLNGNGTLICETTGIGRDTVLAQIITMVQQAQGAKVPVQALVNRITLWFVPAVLAVAATTVFFWLWLGPQPVLANALVAGVSVLIIACPCAMGLATPTSIMVGTGRAAELGILFRQGDALQHLGDVSVVAFDKTGTLTQGRPALTSLIAAPGLNDDTELARIAAAEQMSEHPVAYAIVTAAKDRGLVIPKASDFNTEPGQGVVSCVEGQNILVGNQHFMKQQGVDTALFQKRAEQAAAQGETVFFAAVAGQPTALLSVSDPIKDNTVDALDRLRKLGIELAMITGDGQQTADAVAQDLGISTVKAGVLPAGKVQAIEALSANGASVAFVGDGLNDAPALAHADIGIAIGTGTDVAIEAADVVLMSDNLNGVATAIAVSRQTMKNIRQNLFWAFGYNIVLIPVAAGLFYPVFGLLLSPMLAAGAMALSSVFVVSNALRLRSAAK